MFQIITFLVASIFVAMPHAHAEEACAVFGNVEIICLKKSAWSFTPSERSRAIEEHLRALSLDYSFAPRNLHVVRDSDSTEVVGDDVVVVSLSDEDAADFAMTRDQLAFLVASKARDAIKAARQSRMPKAFFSAILLSVIATLVYLLFLIISSYIFRKLRCKLHNGEGERARPVAIHKHEVVSRELVKVLSWSLSSMRVVLNILAFYLYISFVFSFFPQTSTFMTTLTGHAVKPVHEFYALALDFIPNLFFIIAIVLITKYSLRIIHYVFREIEEGKLQFEGFHPEWAQPTFKLVRFVICAFAFAMAFPYIPGSSSPAFQGVSVVLGLLLSVGSSSAISNIVSGIVISYMRPFHIGDSVKIADTIGDVVEKNLFVTRVRTMKEVEITIPNSLVLKSHIINFSVSATTTGLILNPTVTITYDVPWQAVHDVLIRAAKKTKLIEKHPAPFVLQLSLKDSFVTYELNAYTRDPAKMVFIYSDLHQHIQDGFNEAGITVTVPHFVNVDLGKDEEKKFEANRRGISNDNPAMI